MPRNPLVPFGGFFGGPDPIMSLHRDMNRLFDDIMRGPAAGGRSEQGQGAGALVNANMNVSETENEFRVTVELPGVTEQDIDVTLNNDLLTIRGEKKFEEERGGEKENFHYVERSYGSFQRSLRLPFEANPEQVRASFRDGVLMVTVPKSAEQQRAHRIQIQSGAGSDVGQQQIGETRERTGDGGREETFDPAQTSGGEGSQQPRPGAAH